MKNKIKPEISVKTILTKWLKENGYDGLCDKCDDCGCGIDNIMLCGGCGICVPAYKVRCKKCGQELYKPTKAEITDCEN